MTVDANLENPAILASLIDHTLLKPEASGSDVDRLCREAVEFRFASVCINPCWVTSASKLLSGSPVRVCTVIGFPLGANESSTKFSEAALAISQGAAELDMVQNVGALRSGNYQLVRDEFARLSDLAHANGALLKIILETSLISRDQKLKACALATEAGADFVKTSTGFSGGGATVDDIVLMRQAVGSALGVKASGGVRTLAAVRQMVAAGATRIGTSSGVTILRELREASPELSLPQPSATVPGEPY